MKDEKFILVGYPGEKKPRKRCPQCLIEIKHDDLIYAYENNWCPRCGLKGKE